MIIKFEDYLLEEVRLEDVLKSDSNYINSFKKTTFNISPELLKFVNLKINGDMVSFRIWYNNTPNHDLIKRIKERTSLKGIDEFNILIEKGLRELFENYEIDKRSYALYYSEYNFTLITEINLNDNKIKVATLLPSSSNSSTEKKINIKSTL